MSYRDTKPNITQRHRPERCRREKWILRSIWIGFAAFFVILLLFNVVAFYFEDKFIGRIGSAVLSVWSFVVLPLLAFIWMAPFTYAVRSQERGKSRLLCPYCRFSLIAHQSPGICPECGEPFTHEDIRKAWEFASDEIMPAWLRRWKSRIVPDITQNSRPHEHTHLWRA